MTHPTLYIVATPIGNLEDISYRALKTLKSVDLIAAEDTRHTGKLLQHFQITTAMTSYYQHNQQERLPQILEHLQGGKSVALVSDAGMPGICDPGYELVKACEEAGINIIPIPGAVAAITALAASGLPSDRFVFEGFLPTKSKARCDHLTTLQQETRTLIFYEAPHRIVDTLTDMATVFGGSRYLVLAREITKLYEQFWRGTINEALDYYSGERNPTGEFTIVVKGATIEKQVVLSPEEIEEELKKLFEQGISKSQASKILSHQIKMRRQEIYQLALKIPDNRHGN